MGLALSLSLKSPMPFWLSVTQQIKQIEGPECEMQDLSMALSVGEGFSPGPEEREPKRVQSKAI